MNKPKFDTTTIAFANSTALNYRDSFLRKANRLKLDPDRKKRLEHQQCVVCYYVTTIRATGQSFTEWSCRNCHKLDQYPNTGVPSLCTDCAKKYDVCTNCCADIELKERRILERKKK